MEKLGGGVCSCSSVWVEEWGRVGGLVHYLCWVLICLEDLPQVVPFSNHLGGMANILGSGPQAFDDACLDPGMGGESHSSYYICVSFCELLRWLLGFLSSLPVHQGRWPDGEDIIYIPYPDGGSPEGGF